MAKKSILVRLTTRFRTNGFYMWLLKLTGKNLSDKRWIFIVGCYNSGTTLLDDILSRHPQISGLGDEGVMLTNKLPKPEDFGWRRMWWKCEELMALNDKDELITSKTIKKHWSHFIKKNKSFVLEKSISNTARCLFFERNFNSPYFIHLVRNGYAVSEGIQRKAKVMENNILWPAKAYPVDYCANQWIRSVERIEEDKGKLTNFIEIRYEDLTADPIGTINSILDFIGLNHFSEPILNESFQVHEKESPITNMNERSLKSLTKTEVDVINGIAEDVLMRYGYSKL